MYVRMSKFDADANMYEPFEARLNFPEVADPNAHWSDVWKEAFVKSADALRTGKGGVPLGLGIDALSFADKAGESWSKDGAMVVWQR